MHQGWTKYAAQLWHRYGNNGIATLSYAPSEISTKTGGANS